MPAGHGEMISPVRIVDADGHSAAVLLDPTGIIYRLAVDAIITGITVGLETDNNAIAVGVQRIAGIPLNYMHDPSRAAWVREEGGADNAPSTAGVQAQYFAGIARAALATYTNGDTCVPTFDLTGRLMVNMGGIATVLDNDAVAAGLDQETVIPLNYGYDGTNWRRLIVSAPGTTPVDERLMALWTNSFVRGVNTSAVAGSQGLGVEARALAFTPSIPLTANALVNYSVAAGYDRITSTIQTVSAELLSVSARSPNDARGMYAIAALVGLDPTGTSLYQASAGKADADGTYAKTLWGILLNTRPGNYSLQTSNWAINTGDRGDGMANRGFDSSLKAPYNFGINVGVVSGVTPSMQPTETRAPGTTPLDERYYGLYSLAFVRGINSAAAAGSQGVAVEARDANSSISESLIHLCTRAECIGYDNTLGVGGRSAAIAARLPSGISGTLATAGEALLSAAIATGIDTTGAAVLRPVEARTLSASTSVATGLYGLTTNSRSCLFDIGATTNWAIWMGSSASSVSNSEVERSYAGFVLQARESGFAAARRGKRFTATNSTMGTAVTGQLALVATTPTLMLRINSAAIRAIVRSLSISLANTPGGVTTVIAVLDTLDRYSAAGTAVTPNNTNEESATAAVSLFYENPTATAAGVAPATRVLGHWTIPASVGSILDLEFEDSDLLGPTASTLLIYVYAPTTAPQIFYAMDFEEVA